MISVVCLGFDGSMLSWIRRFTSMKSASSALLVDRLPQQKEPTHNWDLVFKRNLAGHWHEECFFLEGSVDCDDQGIDLQMMTYTSEGKLTSLGSVLNPDIEKMMDVPVTSNVGTKMLASSDMCFSLPPSDDDDDDKEAAQRLAERVLANAVQDAIKSKLFPKAESISLQFRKLALYEEGDEFTKDRTASHTPTDQGTLLVMLHSSHRGGKLICNAEHDDSGEIWRAKTEGWTTNTVDWCAFHDDEIPRKLEPVKSGVRAVLEFDILVEDRDVANGHGRQSLFDDQVNNKIEVPNVTDANTAAFVKRLQPQLKHQSFAVPLFHSYRQVNATLSPDVLKSEDRMLFDAFLKAGYSVMLTPVIMSSIIYRSEGVYTYNAGPADPYDRIYHMTKAGNVRTKEAVFDPFPDVQYLWTKTMQSEEYHSLYSFTMTKRDTTALPW